ncbi:MAG: phosphatidylinositol-4-phosphate 5-kinase, partial [Bacteroidetes bacterium]
MGEFREGQAHGKGILYFANGNKYIGYWAENHRHGSGRFLFA